MTLLVIDTATAACSVALLDGTAVLAERHEVVGRGHAERLVPMIGEVLAQADATRAGGVLVDAGPGSFTGIRVGLAAARALGLAWQVAVRGYSAMAAIAAAAPEDDVTVALAAGHGELFVQRFSDGRPLDAVRSLLPADAAGAATTAAVLGSGAATLVAARGWGEARDTLPRAADARRLRPELAELPPSPIYGRAPDAALPR